MSDRLRQLLLTGAAGLTLAAAAGLGCVLDDLEPRGRPCTAAVGCGPGTVCDLKQGICVPASDGGSDGRVDSAAADPAADNAPANLGQDAPATDGGI